MSGEQRQREIKKYRIAYYCDPDYGRKPQRINELKTLLQELPYRGSFLDVGCGRGKVLLTAQLAKFDTVIGTEVVPELLNKNVIAAEAHALPFSDKSFDVVFMADVIEHLIVGDDELACRELDRVARKCIVVTANNKPAYLEIDEEFIINFHINIRTYKEWDALFREWFSGKVTWVSENQNFISEIWIIEK
jgi:ubiquinone/menaquinone biosynthesis C-methylase UbiE